MFPHTNRLPTGGTKLSVSVVVSRLIASNLLFPVGIVRRSRYSAMDRTSMPEASIYEHGDPRPSEYDVGAPPEAVHRGDIHPISKTRGVEKSPHRDLGLGVACALPLHSIADRWRARPRGREFGPRSPQR